MPWLEREGVRIFYEAHGRGPSVLLSHGYGASSRMWAPQLEGLTDRWRLIVWDLRGHDRSDSPEDPSLYSHDLSVGDMSAVLDACGEERAVIGGLSLGGYLSLAFHLAHPERVAALMLFDTGPGFRNDKARGAWNRFAEGIANDYDARGLAAAGGSPEVRTARHRGAHGLALAARGILTQTDSRVIDSLPTIGVPTLVLAGGNDADYVGPAEYMTAKIPGARKVIVARAGHAPNLEQAETFNTEVASFLTGALS